MSTDNWEKIMQFTPFPKLSRYNRKVIITEKLDGTNASIWITPVDNRTHWETTHGVPLLYTYITTSDGSSICVAVRAGSRNRFITPQDDNYGFANWVFQNGCQLAQELGAGTHYGEWWGYGIQRGYGLREKRFSLFNTTRWTEQKERGLLTLCDVVPVIHETDEPLRYGLLGPISCFKLFGSKAAPGYMNPEGVVIFHTASNTAYKYTFDKNDQHKGETT